MVWTVGSRPHSSEIGEKARKPYARRCGGNRCIRKAWLIHTGCVEDNTFGEIPIHSSLGTSINTTWWTSRAMPSTISQASYQWFGLDPIHTGSGAYGLVLPLLHEKPV